MSQADPAAASPGSASVGRAPAADGRSILERQHKTAAADAGVQTRETQQRLLAEALIELAAEHPATDEELDREVPAYGLSLPLAWAVLTARSPGEVPPVYKGRHQTHAAAFVEGLYDHEVEELLVETVAELDRVRGIATKSRTHPGHT